eukprot:gnl/Hemi2/24032_TR8061_c0_g1_i1.p1 gnl/Hemi2/24032_TR8061_c0_g1~~gnl/Hemi2/24032_TR8061_c0_g1_i1.p1  ORF type:complete len:405 (-),score=89.12 gnl/Hemi2/24032_TR8061_c0_g1_i1:245-1459(-)
MMNGQSTHDALGLDRSVQPSDIEMSNWTETVGSFDDMNLREDLLRGVYAFGFETPSAIQAKATMPFIRGRDVIAQAQSGTGKTAAFAIGILQNLRLDLGCQAMVLCPTRELATQIHQVFLGLSDRMGARIHVSIGGRNMREDMRVCEIGVHVIVGTPGRVYDLLTRGCLNTDDVRMWVLDEVDQMLGMGFRDMMYEIFRMLPITVQVGLYSATMPEEVIELTRKFTNDPVRILVKKEQLTLQGITQFFIQVDSEDFKLDTLCDLYNSLTVTQSLIYVNTKRKVDWLADQMKFRSFTVSYIHGDMDYNEREVVMKEFRTGSSRVLISTDLLARGIDVQAVSLVINYDLPKEKECYLHRIGRSGRYSRKGVAINFVSGTEMFYLKDIESFFGTQIDEMPAGVNDLI